MKLSTILLALTLAACTATIPEGRFVCERDRDCPPDFWCHSDALCYSHAEPDGAVVEHDAGELIVDAGLAMPDSGSLERDAGVPLADAGTDAGIVPGYDAGPVAADAGSDSGVACLALRTHCTVDTECCTHLCWSGPGCSCLAPTTACDLNEQCCSGVCVTGRCT